MAAGKPFDLALFATEPAVVGPATRAGVRLIVVDWEHEGKAARQAFADTQINRQTVEDLRRVRASTDARVVCRVNRFDAWTAREVDEAIDAGADEILLPMVRSVDEVEAALERAAGRAGVGILVETRAAVGLAPALAALPLTRAYVGLNDLAIERGSATIFAPLVDGTLDRVRRAFDDVPFGFGGVTRPDAGAPIPCRLIIGELARLRCGFTFLRRSFYRDVRREEFRREIPRIATAVADAYGRRRPAVLRDRRELVASIAAIEHRVDARDVALA